MAGVRIARIGFLAGLLISFGAGPASAQAGPEERPAIGLAYQVVHFNTGNGGLNYPLGFNVDGAVPLLVNHLVDIVGEFGWARHSEATFTENQVTFDGGVRGNLLTAAARLYGQVTFGVQHGSSQGFSTTDGLFGLDGGVNVPLEQLRRGYLFGQVGYRRVYYQGSGENALRFMIGVRLPLGGT
jgi:hypothetical protein